MVWVQKNSIAFTETQLGRQPKFAERDFSSNKNQSQWKQEEERRGNGAARSRAHRPAVAWLCSTSCVLLVNVSCLMALCHQHCLQSRTGMKVNSTCHSSAASSFLLEQGLTRTSTDPGCWCYLPIFLLPASHSVRVCFRKYLEQKTQVQHFKFSFNI